MALVAPNPLAVDFLQRKIAIRNDLSTDQWATMKQELRDSAFWAAKLEQVKVAQQMQDAINRKLSLLKRSDGVYQTRDQFVVEMQALGRKYGIQPADPGKVGTIQDLTSNRRLKLIYDFQVQRAQEYAKWKGSQNAASLAAFPAQEFIRVKTVTSPRLDWPERWKAAGGKVRSDGRMLALKNDSVWTKLSRFGSPFPPFDFGSGKGLRRVSRREAEDLGLLKKGEVVLPKDVGFNDSLQADVSDLNPQTQSGLVDFFEGQMEIKDGMARWLGLNQPDRAAIFRYSEGGSPMFADLNLRLRESQSLTPEQQTLADALDHALPKLPAYEDEIVYRGETLTEEQWQRYFQPTFTNPHYTSSSFDQAESFAGNVQIKIVSKKGRLIQQYSAKAWQKEVLFGRDTPFKVTHVEKTADGLYVEAEEL